MRDISQAALTQQVASLTSQRQALIEEKTRLQGELDLVQYQRQRVYKALATLLNFVDEVELEQDFSD